ncbi:hypothetical protein LCGC14_1089460 [marine sediment metagenome]|uniref:Uncharacterized protein n=1 Tax=marine sediment metagenome TaxID=412755 RepID=A0A0F9MH94_9ZZZZ
MAWSGLVRQVWQDVARWGLARRAWVRYGPVRYGPARFGVADLMGSGELRIALARRDETSSDMARQVRLVKARPDATRCDWARSAQIWRGRWVLAWRGQIWSGPVRRGLARPIWND